MYSERLDKNNYNSVLPVEYVLENLHKDTADELKKIYGKHYIIKAFNEIKDTDIFVIRLKSTNEPVGLYGLIPQSSKSAGIYLLTTKNLYNGNIIKFLRESKKQIHKWQAEYNLIMDYCSKENKIIQKWLTLLGFQPSNYQDDNFQIYYWGDLSLYNESDAQKDI